MAIFKKPSDKLETLIGSNSEFKGDISVSGTIRIDGKLLGNIVAGWIVVGEDGIIRGDLEASGIIIGGRVEGNVNANDVVEIKPTGYFFGDICSKRFIIAEGGIFVGRSIRHDGETRLIDLAEKEASAR
jgi:cytoskeletal protein CcmA (bactofilin family)